MHCSARGRETSNPVATPTEPGNCPIRPAPTIHRREEAAISTETLLAVAAAVIGGGGLAPYLTYRMSRRTADRQESTAGTQTVLTGFTALLTEAKAARDELRDRVHALEEQSRGQAERIAQLEQGRADDHRRITAAVRYIRTLRKFIRSLGEEPPKAEDESLERELAD